MRPANEQRDAIVADFNQSGTTPMDQAALDDWIDRGSSILARWCVEDGVTLDQVRAGAAQGSELLQQFFHLFMSVGIAQRPDMLKLAIAAAEHLVVVADYGEAAAEAAQRDAIEGFRAAIRKTNLPAEYVELVAMTLAVIVGRQLNVLMQQRIERLRAEVLALGGTLPEDDAPLA